MRLFKILKINLEFRRLFFLSLFFLFSNQLYSQENLLDKLDKEFEDFVNKQDSLFNIYSDDFLNWKDFVDLKKLD
tara:strand:- start:363 stop:587 length:225 start_codon:yes stop_codon:yes gene_type:complete